MANETILIVDADTKSQKVLEVSFKKAGYRVVMTDGPKRARELVADTSPDIIISDTAFPNGGDGFEFLNELRAGASKSVPFIFLTEERSLPQKMKGFELGADDYLTKPIYIKEVTTRVELLLQKRAKESLAEDDIEELEGNLSDITMIDLLQTIEEELRSGTIHLSREHQSAVIYFREGNILDAICGKLQGEESIYRLMLWPDGVFALRYHDQVRRLDRIEKDSGALLLEGIRRLDKYNELVDRLPPLGRVFEADFPRLTQIASDLPDEVGRVVRLFDGLRSIREVCEGSPLDDVTTLQVVERLIEDGLIVDVTPERNERSEARTRSNLANWLDGARSADLPPGRPIEREDTAPKFGSSISGLTERRGTALPERESIRRTLENPFGVSLDDDSSFDDLPDPRRQTHLQWDVRPKSDWNIHFDKPTDNPKAAIAKIEENESRRRAFEAQQLKEQSQPEDVSDDSHREATLRFAPAIKRGNTGLDKDLLERIEADEQTRRNEEARRLQEQLQGLQSDQNGAGTPLRRSTDELPVQKRGLIGRDVSQDVFETGPMELVGKLTPRERVNTPLSTPAHVPPEDFFDAKGPDPGLDVLSEADAFEDDEADLEPRSERTTLNLKPAFRGKLPEPKSAPKADEAAVPDEPVAPDIDPGGLFENLANEDTAPGDDSYDGYDLDLLDELPPVKRQATDRELVHTEYNLARRATVAPDEIEGRKPTWERETVELPDVDERTSNQEGAFFDAETPRSYDFFEDDSEPNPSKATIAWVIVLGLMAIASVGILIMLSGTEPAEEEAEATTVASVEEVVAPEPVVPVIEPPVVEEEPGLDAIGASAQAREIGASFGTNGRELAVVMSGGVIETGEEPTDGTAEATLDQAPEPIATANEPSTEPQPVPEKAPVKASPAAVRNAEKLMQRERHEEALEMLRALSKSAPDDKKIAYLHGIAAFNSNRTSEAIDYLSRAERMGHRTADLYLELAAAYHLDRKLSKAKWAYEKFLKLQPKGRQADEVRAILSTQF